MPIYLKEIPVVQEAARFDSVLIVPCRFCPAASAAIREEKPYIELLRRFLKTEPYERLVRGIKQDLTSRGVKTRIFKSNLLHQFVLCMWTSRKRKKLSKLASGYEALLVLGCEGAFQTVSEIVEGSSCQVLAGMESEGVMSLIPEIDLPCNIRLELKSVTRAKEERS